MNQKKKNREKEIMKKKASNNRITNELGVAYIVFD